VNNNNKKKQRERKSKLTLVEYKTSFEYTYVASPPKGFHPSFPMPLPLDQLDGNSLILNQSMQHLHHL